MLYYARIAKHNRMRWHININETIWCDQHIITNSNFSNDSRIDSNPNSIANSWTTFMGASIRLSYNNTFMNVTIATYFCFTIDGYIICVTYINTPPRFDYLLLFPNLFYLTTDGTRPCTKASLAGKKLQMLFDKGNGKS